MTVGRRPFDGNKLLYQFGPRDMPSLIPGCFDDGIRR